MKVLIINKYLFPKGGDAISALNTGALLESKGHRVLYWGMQHKQNRSFEYEDTFLPFVDYEDKVSFYEMLRLTFNLWYSVDAKRMLEKLIKIEKPDIVHLNNFAHQISPSILHVLKRYQIPSVMTMHDYKMICPVYTMFNGGLPCNLCKRGKFYQCLLQKCSKDSYLKSFINTFEMYLHHRLLKIYDIIKIYISPSQFLMNICKEMGFKKKVIWLPNFNIDSADLPTGNFSNKVVVYFGRLSKEKGLKTLLLAMKSLPDITLNVIGDGPAKEHLLLIKESFKLKNVNFIGYLEKSDLDDAVRKAMFSIVPSEWYENNPRSIIESFTLCKPVIGADIGGIPELVRDNVTGLLFSPGNVEDLSLKIGYLCAHPEKALEFGENAHSYVNFELSAEKHYQKLVEIYRMAMANKC